MASASEDLPKDINEIDEDWVKLHFPSPVKGDSVVLVEDIISANKFNPLFPCVALLGVHLSEEKINYLMKLGITNFIIALDNDATRQAIRIARKYCINTTVLPLERDLKDESFERLIEIAEELNGNVF